MPGPVTKLLPCYQDVGTWLGEAESQQIHDLAYGVAISWMARSWMPVTGYIGLAALPVSAPQVGQSPGKVHKQVQSLAPTPPSLAHPG